MATHGVGSGIRYARSADIASVYKEHKMHKACCPTALIVALAASTVGMSHAIAGVGQPTAHLDMLAQGPGVCQAALPSFEGHIRKRPLAIQNEGTATAFVSCSLPQFTHSALNNPFGGLIVNFINNSNIAASVNCTGVSLGSGFAYIPKTVNVPANTDIDFGPILSWNQQDEGGGSYNVVSCALPPGTGITFVKNVNGQVVVPDPAP